MREHLISYIDLLFRGAQNCEDIKQEILQNTLDRYDDLVSQGKSPEAAYQLAITGIGDLSELLTPRNTSPVPPVSSTPIRSASSKSPSTSKRSNGFTGICWLIGIAIYFIISFTTSAWETTWLILCMIPCVTGIISAIKNIQNRTAGSVIKIIFLSLLLLLLLIILLAGIIGGSLSFGWFSFDGLPGGTEANSGEIDGSSVKNIDIRWVSGKIILRQDPSSRMLTFQEEAGINTRSLAYRVDGDTLTIAFMKEAEWTFGINTEWSDKTLIVTVPTFWGGGEITIHSVSAEVDITDMVGDSLDLVSVSGDVTVTGSGFNNIDIESVSGDIEYSGILLDFQAETISGDCEINSDIACEEIEFESVSGNLKMTLPESLGFTLNLDSVSGDLITNIAVTSSKGSKTYGNGACNISSDTVSGNVYIEHSK